MQRHVSAQQPVHVPGDGEALRLLRDDPARIRHPSHRAGAVQEPLDHEKWAYTAGTYNLPFDLDEVAGRVGYPMFMKPFDGGAWRGVSRVDNAG